MIHWRDPGFSSSVAFFELHSIDNEIILHASLTVVSGILPNNCMCIGSRRYLGPSQTSMMELSTFILCFFLRLTEFGRGLHRRGHCSGAQIAG